MRIINAAGEIVGGLLTLLAGFFAIGLVAFLLGMTIGYWRIYG